MNTKRILSLCLIFTLLLTSLPLSFGENEASVMVMGIDGDWGTGTPIFEISSNVFRGTINVTPSTNGYKIKDGDDWKSFKSGIDNMPLNVSEETAVTFTYYKNYGVITDNLRYPNGPSVRMVGNLDEIGNWAPHVSTKNLDLNGDVATCRLTVPQNHDLEFKLLFESTNEENDENWSAQANNNGDNFQFTGSSNRSLTYDYTFNLLSGDSSFTPVVAAPTFNINNGASVETDDTLTADGTGSVKFTMTQDGSTPEEPTEDSNIFSDFSFGGFGGKTLKFKFVAEENGLLSETTELEVVVIQSESLSLVSTTPNNDATDISDKTFTLTYSTELDSVDESKIAFSPALAFETSIENETLSITVTDEYDMYKTYTLSLEADALTASSLKSDAASISFTTKLYSPVINGNDVTFNAVHDGDTLNLVGSMNGWDNSGIPMTKTANGYFTVTKQLLPGTYEYKFFPTSGSWDNGFTDQLNTFESNGNSAFIIAGLNLGMPQSIRQGETATLSAVLVNADGTESTVTPVWTLKEAYTGVSISDATLSVDATAELGDIILVATQGEVSAELIFTVTEALSSEELLLSSSSLDDNNENISSKTFTLTFNKDLDAVDESKISFTPALEFSATTETNTLSIVVSSDYDMYQNYTLAVNEDALTSGALKNTAITKTFKTKLYSPVINDNAVTFNAVHDGETLNLVGSMNGWDNSGIPMTKTANGYFTVTKQLLPGTYEYKFFPTSGSWDNGFTDQLNTFESNGNSAFILAGLNLGMPQSIRQGESASLTAVLVNADGTESTVTPVWNLKEAYTGVSISDATLSVDATAELGDIILVATQGEVSAELIFTVTEALSTEELLLSSSSLDDNNENISSKTFTLTFNKELDAVDVANIAFSPAIAFDATAENKVLTIVVSDDFTMYQDYTLTLNANAVTSGTLSNSIITKTFKTALFSPIINGNEVTFNAVHDGETLNLVGSMNGWDNTGIPMTKVANGYFTVTRQLIPGTYEYKFFPTSGSWDNGFTDQLNTFESNGNSGVHVSGLRLSSTTEIAQNNSLELTAEMIADDGTVSTVTPVWTLKDDVEGVSITGNTLTVGQAYTGTITLIGTLNTIAYEVTMTVVPTQNVFKLYYYRYDNNYNGYDVWQWYDNEQGHGVPYADDFVDGFKVATVTTSRDHIYWLPRKTDWSEKEVEFRLPADDDGLTEVWIIQGDSTLYRSREAADISAKALAAMFDDNSEIHVLLTHSLEGKDINSFKLNDGDNIIPTSVNQTSNTTLTLTVNDMSQIDVRKNYTVSSADFAPKAVTMRRILDSSQYYYNGTDLGLSYTDSSSTFKVWAPTATQVSVALYNDDGTNTDGTASDPVTTDLTAMTRANNGVWSATVEEDLDGQFYLYKVEFADGTENYAIDPYVKAVSANGYRGAIISLDDTDPDAWASDNKPAFTDKSDAILYELHVRDFSIDENSGMTNKGKYTAFTETSSYNGENTGMEHLKELGITHVHLLPAYDFKTVNEATVDDPDATDPKFNWGYDPQNYNVPEGSYSTDPFNPKTRITEFKEMVQAMHNNDLRVVMDVVYNHTFSINDGPFEKIVPGYYYRTNDRNQFTNGSGCGNEVASERPMVRKYIKDSVKYWVNEYNVDGFRFDLMGLIDLQTMEELTAELKAMDSSLIVYGEPWTAGSHAIYNGTSTTKGTQRDKGFSFFNDNIRGAIKGGSDDDSKGFATGDTSENKINGVLNGIYASDDLTNNPDESITYVTAHDNLVLWDKVLKTMHLDASDPYGTISGNLFDNEAVKRAVLANGIVLTSQGVPFIHAGSEMLRSKQGDHNSYKSSDDINKIRWENRVTFDPIVDYYKGLIELRKAHYAFTMEEHSEIQTKQAVFKKDDGVIAYQLKDFANNDTWKNIIVIYNGNTSNRNITLPFNATWHVVVDNDEAGTDVLYTFDGQNVTVPGLSMMVMYDEAVEAYTPVPTTIETEKDAYHLQVGETGNINALVRDQKNQLLVDETITYTVADTAIATVANGNIHAVSNGDTTITLTCGDVTKIITVQVATKVVSNIQLSGSSLIYQSNSATITAECFDQYNEKMLGQTVAWSSSNETVATVNNGLVTGHAVGSTTITATVDSVQATFDVEVAPYEEKTLRLHYYRPDETYDTWSLWVWDTGINQDAIEPTGTVNINGKTYLEFNIQVSPASNRIGYIIRKGDWEEKDPDQDRFLDVVAPFTKAFATSGQVDVLTQKVITGPEIINGQCTFYYRDADLYQANNMSAVEAVTLKLDDQTLPMVYDVTHELYSVTTPLTEGEHLYTYSVTKNGNTEEINDPYNETNGQSTIVYEKPEVTLNVSLSQSTILADEGTVLKVNITKADDLNIDSMYADLTAIGGPEKAYIHSDLNAITLVSSITGTFDIPVSIIDEFGNVTTETTQLTVNANTATDWDEASIYFMVTDRFNDGDTTNNINVTKDQLEGYHGGDFQGIIDKLDYLEALGINTIWITPIVDNVDYNVGANSIGTQYGYHGYWAKDFTSLDEHLGDLATFKELIDKAHDKDIKIMVDVVLNHTGYGMMGTAEPGEFRPTQEEIDVFDGMLRTNPGSDAITQALAGLPDFITEDPAVRAQIVQWQVDWLDKARTDRGDTIDFFRVDTVKHVEHTTWQAFKNALMEKDPSFKLIGEYYDGTLSHTGNYLSPDQMDSLLDFNFKYKGKDFVEGQITKIENELVDRNNALTSSRTLGQFLSSHDEDGFLTRFNVSQEKLNEYAMLASSLQMTAKGQVVVYYGEEVGLTGRKDNWNENRLSENRYDMVFDQNDPKFNETIYNHYKKMLNIRKDESKVLAKGERNTLFVSDAEQLSIFERAYNDRYIYIGLNIGQQAKTKVISTNYVSGTELIDLYNGITYVVDSNGQIEMTIPAAAQGGTTVIARAPQSQLITHDDINAVTFEATVSLADIINMLPSTISATDKEGQEHTLHLTWSIENFAQAAGTYTATASYPLPVNVLDFDEAIQTQVVLIKKTTNNTNDNSSNQASDDIKDQIEKIDTIADANTVVKNINRGLKDDIENMNATKKEAMFNDLTTLVDKALANPNLSSFDAKNMVQDIIEGAYGDLSTDKTLVSSHISEMVQKVVDMASTVELGENQQLNMSQLNSLLIIAKRTEDQLKASLKAAEYEDNIQSKVIINVQGDAMNIDLSPEITSALEDENIDLLLEVKDVQFKLPVSLLDGDQVQVNARSISADELSEISTAYEAFATYDFNVEKAGKKVKGLVELRIKAPTDETFMLGVFENDQWTGIPYTIQGDEIVFVAPHFSVYSINKFDHAFEDIEAHWAKDHIIKLNAQGLVSGKKKHSFDPEATITRAEFTSMLVKYLNLNTSSQVVYTDVSPEAWFYDCIAKATAAGITTGVFDGMYRPDMPITRSEMAVMIDKAYQLAHDAMPSDVKAFNDISEMEKVKYTSIMNVRNLDIISGYEDNTFRPDQTATRGEAATILNKFIAADMLN